MSFPICSLNMFRCLAYKLTFPTFIYLFVHLRIPIILNQKWHHFSWGPLYLFWHWFWKVYPNPSLHISIIQLFIPSNTIFPTVFCAPYNPLPFFLPPTYFAIISFIVLQFYFTRFYIHNSVLLFTSHFLPTDSFPASLAWAGIHRNVTNWQVSCHVHTRFQFPITSAVSVCVN